MPFLVRTLRPAARVSLAGAFALFSLLAVILASRAAFAQEGTPGTGTCDAGPLKDSQHATRHRLRYNLEARILQDLLGNESSLFVAFIHGQHYSERMLYAVDPHGVPEFAEMVIRDTPVAVPL